MKIDFVSDVACPWCAVGLHALETALDRLAASDARFADGVALHFQPFELNPQMAPEGEDIIGHLGRKYGIDAEQIRRNQAALAARGEAVGFRFGQRERIYNTFDAHRLLMWAEQEGAPGTQARLKHALLEAYHGQGRDPGNADVLAEAAARAGLDAAQARAVLASGRYAEAVREREAHWQGLGISAVPSVVINDRHLIQGGQPPEVFEAALRQIADAG